MLFTNYSSNILSNIGCDKTVCTWISTFYKCHFQFETILTGNFTALTTISLHNMILQEVKGLFSAGTKCAKIHRFER